MVRRKDNLGFTLIETILALALSAMIAAGVVIMFPPSLTLFQELMDSEEVRGQVVSSLEMVGREASEMRAIYLDNGQCYAVCMEYVDPSDDSHHRILYFWQGNNLMRKKELTSANTVNCTNGGHQFVGNLDTSKTSFSTSRELLSVHMAAKGDSNDYQLSAVFMPIIKEREILYTEGFECNSLNQGSAWTPTAGANSSWKIVAGTQGFGRYEMAHVMDSSTLDTASIETQMDMTRYPKAILSFSYRNLVATPLPAGEGLYVDWWDGSAYQTVFSHTNADDPPPTTTTFMQLDITDFGLVSTSRLRFRGVSCNSSGRWHIDNIRISSP